MAKVKKAILHPATEGNIHMGYNEKNPLQPQGSFAPDSMDNDKRPRKRVNKPIMRKKINQK